MAWDMVAFDRIFEDCSRGHTKTKQRDYLEAGLVPIVDQGQQRISGYYDDTKVISPVPLPVVVFGDHTRCVKFVDFPFGAGADGTKILRPKEGVDARFAFWALRATPIPASGYSRHYKFLKESVFPLPPIEEQRRIAAVLDAADALRAKRRQAIAKLDTLTQAIFIDMFGDSIGSGRAETQKLGDIVNFVGGGTPSKSVPEYFTGDICWATSKDMKSRFLDGTQDHITPKAIMSSATKLVEPGAVLVVVKSKILARTLPVSIARVPTCFGQDLKALLPNDVYTSAFVAEALRAGERWLLRRARGVNTEGLTLAQLRELPVPKPLLLSDVQRFENVVSKIVPGQDRLRLSASKHEKLFASLQQRAFRGEL